MGNSKKEGVLEERKKLVTRPLIYGVTAMWLASVAVLGVIGLDNNRKITEAENKIKQDSGELEKLKKSLEATKKEMKELEEICENEASPRNNQ